MRPRRSQKTAPRGSRGWRRAATGWSTCASVMSRAISPKNSTSLNRLSAGAARSQHLPKITAALLHCRLPAYIPNARPRRQAAFTRPERRLRCNGCSCGRHVSEAEHEAAAQLQIQASLRSEQKRYEGVVASAVMRAMLPRDAARRAFLKSVGAATAVTALSQFFPLKTATEAFAQGGPLEKKDLKVGFIPITCATPIIMAAPMGFYAKNGLNVEIIKTAGWAVIRDKTINKEYDAAHMLSPMPLAITMGA